MLLQKVWLSRAIYVFFKLENVEVPFTRWTRWSHHFSMFMPITLPWKQCQLSLLVGSPRMVWLWLASCFFPLPQPLFLAEVFAAEVWICPGRNWQKTCMNLQVCNLYTLSCDEPTKTKLKALSHKLAISAGSIPGPFTSGVKGVYLNC